MRSSLRLARSSFLQTHLLALLSLLNHSVQDKAATGGVLLRQPMLRTLALVDLVDDTDGNTISYLPMEMLVEP
jgi:hypothetical protein